MSGDIGKTIEGLIESLRQRKQQLWHGGRDQSGRRQEEGKLSARGRIYLLADTDSFQELGLFAQRSQNQSGVSEKEAPAAGVVTGAARVDGRTIHLASQDFTVLGGTVGRTHALKIVDVMRRSVESGSPFVSLNESAGARLQDGIAAMSGYGQIFHTQTQLSGVIPQISLICGSCAGGASCSAALTDFVIQTRQAQMFLYGPAVVKQLTGQETTAEALGGAETHMARSGAIHFIAADDAEAIGICRRLLSFLPSSSHAEAPRIHRDSDLECGPELASVVPLDPQLSYDVRKVIIGVVDEGDFLEVQESFAANMVVGFARVLGRTVGIVANQPSVLTGTIDANAADKASRFIRFCDDFNIPIVTFVDAPGFHVGGQQEHGEILRQAARLLSAYASAAVPKIQFIIRKSYGAAHVAMGSKELGTDYVFAWPTAEIALMGAESAVEVLYREEIKAAADKPTRRAELAERYRSTMATPYIAAANLIVDDIIEPTDTRKHLASSLETLWHKHDHRPRRTRGLIPL